MSNDIKIFSSNLNHIGKESLITNQVSGKNASGVKSIKKDDQILNIRESIASGRYVVDIDKLASVLLAKGVLND